MLQTPPRILLANIKLRGMLPLNLPKSLRLARSIRARYRAFPSNHSPNPRRRV
jgi:hypothetical protein